MKSIRDQGEEEKLQDMFTFDSSPFKRLSNPAEDQKNLTTFAGINPEKL
jgi:hypothetical protein